MAIIDLQRGIAEAGRIRIGQTVPDPKSRTGTRPTKLGTFRLTSPDKQRIEEAAALFGGTVAPWKAPAGNQWEVITKATALDVIVPPQAMAFSQFYELWSGGGCQRRCDGETEVLSEQPCLCDPEKRDCSIHTRLSLMIRDLPGLALWRLDTQGWYAGREIAGAVEILSMAAGRGILLPARLLLEQRSVKRPDKDGKPQTMRFAVPRLDPGITPGELLLAAGPGGTTLPQLTEGPNGHTKLTPVPQLVAAPSIAEQSAPPAARPARSNAAPAIPASGRRRGSRSAPKQEGDEGYWRARAFADGAERGIDADRMRELAATYLKEPVDGFSMGDLDEAAWEAIHGLVIGFPVQDAPGGSEDPSQLPESTDEPDEAGGAGADTVEGQTRAAELSHAALLDELKRLDVSVDYAIERSKALYPRDPGVALTDEQRAGLIAALEAELTTAVL